MILVVVVMMDTEKFIELYNSNLSYEKIAKELEVSISTIQSYKKQLNLPTRIYQQETFQFDEALFRKLYESGTHYLKIAEVLGCSTGTITNIRRRLNLVPLQKIWLFYKTSEKHHK
jgi:transposase